jgi:hypothetical protein
MGCERTGCAGYLRVHPDNRGIPGHGEGQPESIFFRAGASPGVLSWNFSGHPEGQSLVQASGSNTFEVPKSELIQRYTDKLAYRGAKCYLMPPPDSYSPRLEMDFSRINQKKPVEIDATVMMFSTDSLSVGQLVLEVHDKKTKERLVWKSTCIKQDQFLLNKWFPCTFRYVVPKEYLFPEYFIRVYVWNCSKGLFYIDDLTLEAKGLQN